MPTNAIAAAAQSAMLPLVVFALFLGFALTQIQPERRAMLVEFFQSIADAMIVIVRWVLWVAPLGVFALILAVCARAGASMLGALGIYVLVECLLYLAVTLAMLAVAVLLGRREAPPLRRRAGAGAGGGAEHAVVAGVVAGDAGKRQRRLGYPERVTALVLPMAVSLCRLTSPVQYVVSASLHRLGLRHRPVARPR